MIHQLLRLIDELKSQNLSGRLIAEFDLDILESDPSKDLILQDGDSLLFLLCRRLCTYLVTSTDQLFFNLIHLILAGLYKLAGGTKDSATNDILLIAQMVNFRDKK